MALTAAGVAVTLALTGADSPAAAAVRPPSGAMLQLPGRSAAPLAPEASGPIGDHLPAPAATTDAVVPDPAPSPSSGVAPPRIEPVVLTTDLPDRRAATAVRVAMSQIGLPYVWGGDGPSAGDAGFDCSGLTTFAYARAGVNLPRTAHTQFRAGPRLPAGAPLQPGDLVFYGTWEKVHHVGMYIGGGRMVNAPTFGQPVRTAYYRWTGDDYIGASRPAASGRGSALLAAVPAEPAPEPSRAEFVAPAAPRPSVVTEPRADRPPEQVTAAASRRDSDADIAAGRVPAPPRSTTTPPATTTTPAATAPGAATGSTSVTPSAPVTTGSTTPAPAVPGLTAGDSTTPAPATTGSTTPAPSSTGSTTPAPTTAPAGDPAGAAPTVPSSAAGPTTAARPTPSGTQAPSPGSTTTTGTAPQPTAPRAGTTPVPTSATPSTAPSPSAPSTSSTPTTSTTPAPTTSATPEPTSPASTPTSASTPTWTPTPAPAAAPTALVAGVRTVPVRAVAVKDGLPASTGVVRDGTRWTVRLPQNTPPTAVGDVVALRLDDGRTLRWTITSRTARTTAAGAAAMQEPFVLLLPDGPGRWTVLTGRPES